MTNPTKYQTRPSLWHAVTTAMLVTDIGFILYWAVTVAGILPPELAYKDYLDPILTDWNYSFMVLDILASVTGLIGLRARNRTLVIISLALTFTAGLQALSFWTLRADFTLTWWLPNAWLLLFPIPATIIATQTQTLH